jgi:peptidoglycan/LPS O-acetylase OafA/YrhL
MTDLLLLRKPMTLADGLRAGRDNYLLLRHVAAALLIYSHSYALAGVAGGSDLIARLLPGFYGGRVAVLLFFAISGFLVTNSYLRLPRLPRFVAARVLRIYPAYVACLAVTVVLTGLWFTSLSPRAYFTDPGTWRYLLHNLGLSGLQYTLPGAFDGSRAYSGVVNGSLWSLALEARLYLYLAVLALLQVLRWRRLAAALAAGFVVASLWLWPELAPDTEGKRALTLVFAAAAGAACVAEYVPVSTRLLALLGVATWLLRDSACAYGLTIAGIAYFSCWFAYRLPALPLRFPGDYSYGLFLYGFPVQQALAALWPSLPPDWLTALALPTALLFAIASWHLIERRALSLKPRRAPQRAAVAEAAPQGAP